MKTTTNHDEYARMGLAALLPGMRHMLELMQKALDEKQDLLTAFQQGIEEITPKRRVGRPPGAKNKTKSGWPADPQARKLEMRRRIALRGKVKKTAKAEKTLNPDKPGQKLHPRDARHPEHEKWLAKMRKVQRKHWGNMTPTQRKARIEKMAQGKPTVKLAVAS